MRGPRGTRQTWDARQQDRLPGRSSGHSGHSLGAGRSPGSDAGAPGTHSLDRTTEGRRQGWGWWGSLTTPEASTPHLIGQSHVSSRKPCLPASAGPQVPSMP